MNQPTATKQLPDCLCPGCGAEQITLTRSTKVWSDPDPTDDGKQIWIGAEYYVQCQACGHKFQLSITWYG